MAESWRIRRNAAPKQCLALDRLTNRGIYVDRPLDSPFVLVGGAGFGGKSHLIRTAAVEILLEFRRLGFPDQEIAVFCSTMPNLKDRQIGKIRKEFRGFADVVGSQIEGPHVRFHGRGTEGLGIIKLRSVAEATSAAGKKGAEFSAILVDELTEFTREQFGELLYMLRSPDGLPFVPFLGATNPDGIGHDWVKKMFVGPNLEFPEETDYRDFSDEDPAIQAMRDSFYYIPMKKADNATYAGQAKRIDMRIAAIQDPEIRLARDKGTWGIFTGGRFTTYSKKIHGFDWKEMLEFYGYDVPENYFEQRKECERMLTNAANFGFELFGSFDYGTAIDGASAFYLHAVDGEKNIWTFNPDGQEAYWSGMNLIPQAKKLLPFVQRYNPRIIYCDPALLGKESESKDKIPRIRKFASEGIRMKPGANDRIEGWSTMETLLEYDRLVDEETGRTVVVAPPKWRIHNNCVNLHKQLGKAPRDKSRKEDVSKDFTDDHAIDSVRYFLYTRFRGGIKLTKPPEKGSLKWLVQQRQLAKSRDAWD